MDNIDLSAFFKTKSQATDFSGRLSAIIQELYATNFNLEKSCMHHFGIGKKDAFLSLLRTNKIPLDDPSVLKAFFEKLQEKITAVPLIPITLAFEPNEKTLDSLTDWCTLNLKRQVVFDISVDPKLIAGATITYNGKFKDFSIRATFEKIWKQETTPQHT